MRPSYDVSSAELAAVTAMAAATEACGHRAARAPVDDQFIEQLGDAAIRDFDADPPIRDRDTIRSKAWDAAMRRYPPPIVTPPGPAHPGGLRGLLLGIRGKLWP